MFYHEYNTIDAKIAFIVHHEVQVYIVKYKSNHTCPKEICMLFVAYSIRDLGQPISTLNGFRI